MVELTGAVTLGSVCSTGRARFLTDIQSLAGFPESCFIHDRGIGASAPIPRCFSTALPIAPVVQTFSLAAPVAFRQSPSLCFPPNRPSAPTALYHIAAACRPAVIHCLATSRSHPPPRSRPSPNIHSRRQPPPKTAFPHKQGMISSSDALWPPSKPSIQKAGGAKPTELV